MRWLLVFLCACSGLETLERNVCGNDIVEPGEDCDGAPYCEACGIRCDADRTCHGFAAYVCGRDGFCHAPGGEFAPAMTVPFAASEAAIADVDGDGAGDLVGIGSTALVTLFGDPVPARTHVMATPSIQGAAAFADLDGDNFVEVVIPTIDGVVSYSSRFGSLAAEPFPTDVTGDETGASLTIIAMERTGPALLQTRIGVFNAEQPSDTLNFEIVDVVTGDRPDDELALCGAKGADFDRERFDAYSIVTPGRHEMIGVLVLGPPGALRTCAFSMVFDEASDTYRLVEVPLATQVALPRPVLVDLTAGDNACPSLMVGARTYVPGRLVSIGGNTICGFDTTTRTLQVDDAPAAAIAVGRLRLAPAISGVAPDALVLDTGVYTVAVGQADILYRADRSLSRIETADFDRDGDLDAIAIANGTNDLDILLRAPPLGAMHGFVPFRMATEGAPHSLAIGDFDGNGRDDVAFGERIAGSERLMIAYGTADRLLDPVHVASFERVLSISPLNIVDASDPTATISDLVVVDFVEGAFQPYRVSGLHGSAGRTMLPSFNPRLGGQERFHAAIAGKLDADDLVDLIIVDLAGAESAMWWLFGEPNGLRFEDLAVASPIRDCPNPGGACATARYLAHAGHVFGLDASGTMTRFDSTPACVQPDQCALGGFMTRPLVDETIIPHRPLVFDVGNDGVTEILHTYATVAGGGVHFCTDALACDPILPLITAIDPDVIACVDAAPGVIGRAGRDAIAPRDLVVTCRTRSATKLFRVDTGVTELLSIPGQIDAHSIVIGDVTGDSVDDVVLLRATTDGPVVDVLRQRTSREVR